jgi:hypothetical protein
MGIRPSIAPRHQSPLIRLLIAHGVAFATVWSSANAATFDVSSPVVLAGSVEQTVADGASRFAITGGTSGSDFIFFDGFDGTTAWDITVPSGTPFSGDFVTLASVDVPPGQYVAFARLQVITGIDPPGNNFRFYCTLGPSFDFGDYRVGLETSVERYVTFQGAATFDSTTNVSLICLDGNQHTDNVLSGKMTVIRVAD